MPELPKTYDPSSVESLAYQIWLDANAFHADPAAGGTPYTIVIPPPNVTGALHLGHAIDNTLQDILIRRKRMQGFNTLWMPGIDHAGIATQAVVEKELKEKENKNRHDIGREALVERIWKWKEQYGNRIIEQLKRLGASCDWARTRFTLDEVCARAVRETFFKLFQDGLIYRGQRLVNWDVQLQTAVADDEIFHETIKGGFWTFRYPVKDSGEFIKFSTTRPETMLGDTAVAVHPDDPRYAHLHGKSVIIPLLGREIPIITDGELVDPKLGTGAVKVTPAHDPNDYAAWQRQKGAIGIINIMTPEGKINENGGQYAGLTMKAAREKVVDAMDQMGFFDGREDREIPLAHSDRSKTPIEPYLSDQWFVRMGDDQTSDNQSRDRQGATQAASAIQPVQTADATPHSNAQAYFLTFHTFATWLHGDEPGSVDPQHSDYDTLFIAPDPKLTEMKRSNTDRPPLELTVAQRQSVLATIQEVAAYRGWLLHAVNVRSTHVHAVVSGPAAPERMMNDFKSYATRRMVEAKLLDPEIKAWSRHGSTKYLWKDQQLAGATHYTLHEQGENPPGTAWQKPSKAQSEPRPSGSDPGASTASGSLPYGRGSEGLAQTAMNAVQDGRVKFFPDRYAKTYLDWLGEKRDWCISRQLWWGHRIPVWSGRRSNARDLFQVVEPANAPGVYLTTINGQKLPFIADASDADVVRLCVFVDGEWVEHLLAQRGFVQDPDVLDTWFSSALWPHSTLGWPEKTAELGLYYPTNVLVTGRDIITLWVARMVITGLYNMGQVPFGHVHIHPTILDGKGERMSKSKGNGVDPVEIIESYGADALRFTLAQMATETQDARLPVKKDAKGRNTSEKFEAGRNFCNKLWNAARFALSNLSDEATKRRSDEGGEAAEGTKARSHEGTKGEQGQEGSSAKPFNPQSAPIQNPKSKIQNPSLADRWILSRLARTVAACDEALEVYHFDAYAKACYDFFWRDLCDWYIEAIKPQLKEGSPRRHEVAAVLAAALDGALRLMHPMIPFITETIWWKLNEVAPQRAAEGRSDEATKGPEPLLIKAAWPKQRPEMIDESAEADFARIQELISAIRNLRNEYKVDQRKSVGVSLSCPADLLPQVQSAEATIELLAACQLKQISANLPPVPNAARATSAGCDIYVEGLVDADAEKQRLSKLIDQKTKQRDGMLARLSNEAYIAKAPPHLVQQTRDQLAALESELTKLAEDLNNLA